MEEKNKVRNNENGGTVEDATKYGEFVSSYFAWISPDEQKKKANQLENITKDIQMRTENSGKK